MFGDSLPDLGVHGEGGIDVFQRRDEPDQRRARFHCLGRVVVAADGRLHPEPYEPAGQADPDRLLRAARALTAEAAAPAFRLTDATGFPRVLPAPAGSGDGVLAGGHRADGTRAHGTRVSGDGAGADQDGRDGRDDGAARTGSPPDPVILFLRIDFLRAWTLADLAIGRLQARLATSPAAELARPGELAAQVALAYDFNRIGAGIALARALLPVLPPPAECADGHAFALRMLGDLALRGGAAAPALACFEAALAIGDNPHRRARARAAARALGDPAALARHDPAPVPAPVPAHAPTRAPVPGTAPVPAPAQSDGTAQDLTQDLARDARPAGVPAAGPALPPAAPATPHPAGAAAAPGGAA